MIVPADPPRQRQGRRVSRWLAGRRGSMVGAAALLVVLTGCSASGQEAVTLTVSTTVSGSTASAAPGPGSTSPRSAPLPAPESTTAVVSSPPPTVSPLPTAVPLPPRARCQPRPRCQPRARRQPRGHRRPRGHRAADRSRARRIPLLLRTVRRPGRRRPVLTRTSPGRTTDRPARSIRSTPTRRRPACARMSAPPGWPSRSLRGRRASPCA